MCAALLWVQRFNNEQGSPQMRLLLHRSYLLSGETDDTLISCATLSNILNLSVLQFLPFEKGNEKVSMSEWSRGSNNLILVKHLEQWPMTE